MCIDAVWLQALKKPGLACFPWLAAAAAVCTLSAVADWLLCSRPWLAAVLSALVGCYALGCG